MFDGLSGMVMKKLLSLITCVWIVSTAGHEIFSSTDQIMQLVEEERYLLDIFKEYIDVEEENLNTLKAIHKRLTQLSNFEDSEEIMNDPVAAYKLIRRLRNEWLSIVNSTQESLYEVFQNLLHSDVLKIPSNDDLEGAALGLIELQEIYKLYPEDMIEGYFSSDEAFHVGLVAYEQEKFQLAFHWFLYSLEMLFQDSSVTKQQLLYYLSFSAYKFGSLSVAIDFIVQRLNLDPTDENARYLLTLYRLHHFRSSDPDIYTLKRESTDSYGALCRGEVNQRTYRRQRALSCRYSTGGGNPRLILAPLKEEIEWDEPRIIRYHDIISDKEIELLKDLSRPQLSRSKIYSGISKIRVSQSVFLDENDTVVARVSQRIADATGLSMETAEKLHVQNYGIGGKYEPHYDAWYQANERIATFLIYMSDVKIGGATVFPKVGVALQPKKGSAVFWYNLEKNGDVDLRTEHAGCPVFVGNKWVANKWIHEFGQEFRRPCSLSEWE
ncbi:prolyl 4-hydroxylase subunit alpha-1-like isoform X1 [Misgurnus anguillicaudatus]|uniref:prolyl 4-hydroxylase subunit alpha-1-like isoform X1 n=1 Tax=Misgurnus anguillicaudatus TaxID=75329 RepID=UPI003CCFDDAA